MRSIIPPHLSLQETSPEVAVSIQSLIDHIDELDIKNKNESRRFASELKQAQDANFKLWKKMYFMKPDNARLAIENASFQESNMNLLQENLALKEANAISQEINNNLLQYFLVLKEVNAVFQEINSTLLRENFGLEADLDMKKGCVETEKTCNNSRGVMQQIKESRDILASHAHTVSAMVEKYDKIIDGFPTLIDDFPNLRNEPELRMVAEMQKILLMKEQLGLPLAEVGLKERVRVCEMGFPRLSIKK